jgi:hypothetical protein
MSSQLQGANALTAAFTSGALAIGSTTSQFTNAATITYAINGRFYSRATIASQALVIEPGTGIVPTAPNTLQSIPAGSSCAFSVILDTAGAFTVAQGPIVEGAAALCPVAVAPAGKAIVGVIKVGNGTTAAFVPGTTALNAANLTTTYINLSQHPGAAV